MPIPKFRDVLLELADEYAEIADDLERRADDDPQLEREAERKRQIAAACRDTAEAIRF